VRGLRGQGAAWEFVLSCVPAPLSGFAAFGARKAHMNGQLIASAAPAQERKWVRVLQALANGRQLTRFDAEGLGDHSLNSTVAYLEGEKGITISRVPVIVPGRFGEVHCLRYRLDDEARPRALLLLGSP
jgi:hypothetical protein